MARWSARLAHLEAEVESSRADSAACGVRAAAAERAAVEHERMGASAAAEARGLRAELSVVQARAEHEAARSAVAERALAEAEARCAAAEGEARAEAERARHAEVEAETARETCRRLSGGASLESGSTRDAVGGMGWRRERRRQSGHEVDNVM
eukprot:scaffold20225_cov121-Isochrysis_galbana.AAC.8